MAANIIPQYQVIYNWEHFTYKQVEEEPLNGRLLGYATAIAPVRSASDIHQVISLEGVEVSELEWALKAHPAFITLTHCKYHMRLGFISKRTVFESLLGHIVRYCWAEDSTAVSQSILLAIGKIICGQYRIQDNDLLDIALRSGLVEEASDCGFSASYAMGFLEFCQHWDLIPQINIGFNNAFDPSIELQIALPLGADLKKEKYWLENFDDEERQIVNRLFIDNATLEEVAGKFGLSRESIRQKRNKVQERFKHKSFSRNFGYELGRLLILQPSFYFIDWAEIADGMETYFGQQVGESSLKSVLKAIGGLQGLDFYESGKIWIRYKNEVLIFPDLSAWENQYEIDSDALCLLADKCFSKETSPWERGLVKSSIVGSRKTPKRLLSCALRTLHYLKRPAHVTEIVEQANDLFPEFPEGLSFSKISPVLLNASDDDVAKVAPATYALPQYADVEMPDGKVDQVELTERINFQEDLTQDYTKIRQRIVEEKTVRERNLFAGIEPDGSGDSFCLASVRVVNALEDLPEPRSLCELQINENEYKWLCTSMWGVDGDMVRNRISDYRTFLDMQNGKQVSRALCTGVLLLLFVSEVGRREGEGSTLWPFVREWVNESARPALFQSERSISHRFKENIEETCRHFNLRHVFGIEGTQSYYMSVGIQFGLYRTTIKRLPFFLTGNHYPKTLAWLLSSELRSETFRTLFFALRDYRFGHISHETAREIIDASPWTCPGWTPEILKAALGSPQVRDQFKDGTNTAEIEETASPEVFELFDNPEILHSPRLIWDDSVEPYFECQMSNLSHLELNDDRYDLYLKDQHLESIFRQEDGTYRIPGRVRLPLENPNPNICLQDRQGQVAYEQMVTLWDNDEDDGICLFQARTGKGLNAWEDTVQSEAEYFMLIPTYLEMLPKPDVWLRVGDGNWQLFLLKSGWPSDLKVCIDGETLWYPALSEVSPKRSGKPVWSDQVRIRPVQKGVLEIGEEFSLVISNVPSGATVQYISINKQIYRVSQVNGMFVVDDIKVTAPVASMLHSSGKVEVVGSADGRRFRFSQVIDVDIKGAIMQVDGIWQSMFIGQPRLVRELRSHKIKVLLPRRWRGEGFSDLALMEGSVSHGRLYKTAHTIDGLSGMGAPLRVQKQYNCMLEDRVLTISDQILDRGFIDDVSNESDKITIKLNRRIEPGSDHRMIVLDAEGVIHIREVVADTDGGWVVQFDKEFVAIGMDFRGQCLGAWWGNQVESYFKPESVLFENIQQTALLIRWLHLPIFSRMWMDDFAKFMEADLYRILKVWLGGQPTGWVYQEDDDDWLSGLHSVLSRLRIQSEQANDVFNLFVDAEENPIDALHRLGQIHPIFMARILMGIIQSSDVSSSQPTWAQLLQYAKNVFLRMDSNASSGQIRDAKYKLLQESAKTMGVQATNFIENVAQKGIDVLLNKPLKLYDKDNLETAMNVQPFKRYLCVAVLEWVLTQLPGD